ncbi:hypothetical protein [Escherichia coli]|uniref:hypothetical protein n=1 Tax=Escherichia coli TaxID=562 RepID=UPI0020BD63C9|nr:hypothetical protein [Escherichia coli]HCZ3560797.1 hypothetical protein [Escherichia coli]
MESMAEGMIKDLVASGHALADDMTGAPSVLVRCLATQLEVQLVRANALAAENAVMLETIEAVRSVADNSSGIAGWHLNGDIATWEEILPEINDIETTATDTFLDEVRAQGVEMFADHLLCPDLDDTIRDFAAQLRKGGNQ